MLILGLKGLTISWMMHNVKFEIQINIIVPSFLWCCFYVEQGYVVLSFECYSFVVNVNVIEQ